MYSECEGNKAKSTEIVANKENDQGNKSNDLYLSVMEAADCEINESSLSELEMSDHRPLL